MNPFIRNTIAAIFVMSQLVAAQVIIESVMRSDGFMGQGAFESNTKTFIQGDAQRTETQLRFTGSIMKHFSPKGTEIDITRLDKQLIWKFNDQQKTYRETTFAEMKELLEQGKSEFQEQQPPMEMEDDRESDYQWEEPVVKVEKLGDKQKINGFDCEHYLVSVMTVGTHKETGVKDTLTFVSDLWNTKGLGEAEKTLKDFQKKYMDALGFDKPDNMGLAMLSSLYLNQMKDLEKEVGKLEGYPILNTMTLTSTKHATAGSEEVAQEESESEQEAEIALDDIKGSLGGLFGKKLGNMAKKKVEKKKPEGNTVQLFKFTNETKMVKVGPVESDQFEVPAGYELQK